MRWFSPGILCVVAVAAEPPVQVVRVCEALQDLSSYAGKPLAIVGRFSFRSSGRFLSEEGCDQKAKTQGVLKLAFNAQTAPKPPQPLILDEGLVVRKLKQIKQATALREFRFGSQDYDRWAIVYGRLDPAQEKPTQGSSPADLVCRGEGVIVFLDDPQ